MTKTLVISVLALAAAGVSAQEVGRVLSSTPVVQQVAQSNVTKIAVASMPSGADIEVDGSFVGNTPSTIEVPAGEHAVTVSKNGFKSWERKLKASGGNVSLNVELEAK